MNRIALLPVLSALALTAVALPHLAVAAALAPSQASAAATADDGAPVLVSLADWRRMAETGNGYPPFAEERARVEASVRRAMNAGVNVPRPTDPGGGFTHEQHKRNYRAIHEAGTLYRLTGDEAYSGFVRDLLLEYARLYPTLGPHPEGRGQVPGRLFWQQLNDAVWLVYASQGYDAVRETLSPQDRQTIDNQVFRRMARFLSDESAENFSRIHNHATWSVAAVGMTGYVLRDRELVDKALLGLDMDGTAGFLRQIDQLFSPDGYYEEGPYYQRYALAPFVIFGRAIQQNDPARDIFGYSDGTLLRAVDTLIQTSYGGLFFPLNDAIKDKGLDTEELVTGLAIAYARTSDPALLSIARRQGRTLLSPDGLAVAQGLAEGREAPFEFRSVMLRDGPDGDRGGLAILRAGNETGQTLVMKNTAQGMGHGHFDKLNWLFYDNGHEVITDYGAARFLNVEAKSGGIYLPENRTWAKETIAHNTLVVNQTSHFGSDLQLAETLHPTPLLFETGGDVSIVSARMEGAYDGVVFTRTMALLTHPEFDLPVVVDLLRVDGTAPARYDLPLHFNGHVMTMDFEAERHVGVRPVLGDAAGYQHLWVDATSPTTRTPRSLTWLLDGRFYSYRFGADAASQALMVESGANDPNFNLRREQALIQRVEGQADAVFFSVLEPHGQYDGTAETVTGGTSRIRAIDRIRGAESEVIVLTLISGKTLALAVADDPDPGRDHRVVADGRTYQWTGAYARFDR